MGLCCSLGWHRVGPGERGRAGGGRRRARQRRRPPASLRGANTAPQYSGLGLHQSDPGLSLGLTWAKDSRHHTLIKARLLEQLSLARSSPATALSRFLLRGIFTHPQVGSLCSSTSQQPGLAKPCLAKPFLCYQRVIYLNKNYKKYDPQSFQTRSTQWQLNLSVCTWCDV